MPLRVLGGMDQQSEHGRGKLKPADSPGFEERRLCGPAELRQGAVDLALELFGERHRRWRRSSGLRLVRQERMLRRRERLAESIGEEPIQAAGSVADMEAHRGGASWTGPEIVRRKRIDSSSYILHGLEKSVSHGPQEGRNVHDFHEGAAKPDFEWSGAFHG